MLKESIAKFLKLDHLLENLTGYVETRIEIMKYDLKEDLSRVLSNVTVMLVLVLLGTFFLFFLSIAVGLELSQSMGPMAGFGMVSGFYLLVGLILYATRKSVALRVEKEIKELIKQNKK